MKKLLCLVALAITYTSYSQEIKFCGQTEQTQKLFEPFHGSEREAEAAAEQLDME